MGGGAGRGPTVNIIVKCFETDHLNHQSYVQDNKMFEVLSTIQYLELQEIVNKKYAYGATQINFINQHDE